MHCTLLTFANVSGKQGLQNTFITNKLTNKMQHTHHHEQTQPSQRLVMLLPATADKQELKGQALTHYIQV